MPTNFGRGRAPSHRALQRSSVETIARQNNEEKAEQISSADKCGIVKRTVLKARTNGKNLYFKLQKIALKLGRFPNFHVFGLNFRFSCSMYLNNKIKILYTSLTVNYQINRR